MIKTNMLKCFHSITFFVVLILQTVYVQAAYTIEVTSRHLYGPGPFPDQILNTAWIRNLHLDSFLTGKVSGFNNLGKEPNVSGERLQGKVIDGMLSDNTLINEDIDMSNAVIMNGQFNLLLAAVFGGSNKGDTFFYKDQNYNWWIKDDIAIDPGFPAGIVKINNFTFSTAPRIIPQSIQAQEGYPGGTNQAGSLEAGRVALGRLGDEDSDGYLDGIFNAIGRFPMESIFLPGAPFVQLFEFKSDIPIVASDAALLSIASAHNYAGLLNSISSQNSKHVDIPVLQEKINTSIGKTVFHLKKSGKTQSRNDCAECKVFEKLVRSLQQEIWTGNGKKTKPVIEDAFKTMIRIHQKKNV